MDLPRSSSGNGEDATGIPDDLRCKRSDGKQWRCTAMSMPDKTVCEKHYIQAKKRAANSAMRANLKKKKKSLEESDEFDTPLVNKKIEDFPLSALSKKVKEKATNQSQYSPDAPSVRSSSMRENMKLEDDSQQETQLEENWLSYKTPVSAMDDSCYRLQRSFDDEAEAVGDSDNASDEGFVGQTCHQCQRNDRDRVIWCLKCDKRGYCDSCISTCYSDIPHEEIEKACPGCCGSCNCKVCLRADNLIKVRIREIPVLEKLQYLYFLLSSVLPVVKKIHDEQCSEVELEKKLLGTEIDLFRAKLNADEQMCCNFCRIPIIDYHRHCPRCSYDLCIGCCRELREEPTYYISSEEAGHQTKSQDEAGALAKARQPKSRLNLLSKYPEWKANGDDSIPCPPKEYGGCGHVSLNLHRIFKMNWVAKLVKNVDELVSGCKVYDVDSLEKVVPNDCHQLHMFSAREGSDDNLLYCPSVEDIRLAGIGNFRRQWVNGRPVIVKQVIDATSVSSWDPTAIWRGIKETSDEKIQDDSRIVKAINCLDGSEVDIELELGEFIRGYMEGRSRETGEAEILKLKDWPSPSASEEFLMYQRPEFITKLPLLEYIHSRLGLLNVAAKLPHYSLQNDVGPKIFISYGTTEELGQGDSVIKLHFKMRDMVYILVNAHEVKREGHQKTKNTNLQKSEEESLGAEYISQRQALFDERRLPDMPLRGAEIDNGYNDRAAIYDNGIENNRTETSSSEEKTMDSNWMHEDGTSISESTVEGASWDVFRRQDIPKLAEYLSTLTKDSVDGAAHDFMSAPLYDEVVYLSDHHKRKLKEGYGVEPWSFKQCLGQAVFIPAGCPFQMRNLQSNVQLGLDFLFPESVSEAISMAEEIRCLPNNHEAKLQISEVGKISLYAASSAIKEVQKLVLDPKLGAELGFEDPNLTAVVSENLEKFDKRRHVTCP